MLVRWISGALIGTFFIAITSPIFVRSYLPRQLNRGVWTLPAGSEYRWRSEGYATTAIGPHGMPGKAAVPPTSQTGKRIALWGDSQAEGVCVDDDQKIFSLVEQKSDGQSSVFPLAQSGDDLGDWIRQMPWADQTLSVTDHALVIAELSDLHLSERRPDPPHWSQSASTNLPAFILAAARNLAMDADGSRRRLRFSVGPVQVEPSVVSPSQTPATFADQLRQLRSATSGRITIFYAPKLPEVNGDEVRTHDGDDAAFEVMRSNANELGIAVVDIRPALIESAEHGNWPHGFHNGRIGSGHLNATGNAIVANAIRECLQ
ncbi:hypothetical protein [Rubripirellula reticaptiva]|uniref:SGNH hydrolase-type esterase domain-containing protein n=1 Tax=Rubripirellula reticaptiva TaxID=2528013 RepID=A0A5C6EIV8_9BACT|nr:hypothetical protein [Rubripirellula reticaptiva]TWU48434.1 hypothetical protein Poly59_52820 [Rubripirellula reticaptiva]